MCAYVTNKQTRLLDLSGEKIKCKVLYYILRKQPNTFARTFLFKAQDAIKTEMYVCVECELEEVTAGVVVGLVVIVGPAAKQCGRARELKEWQLSSIPSHIHFIPQHC